jgi:hypothetical protein
MLCDLMVVVSGGVRTKIEGIIFCMSNLSHNRTADEKEKLIVLIRDALSVADKLNLGTAAIHLNAALVIITGEGTEHPQAF